MAISLVNSATIAYTSTTSPQTTATFTWAIGDVLVVVAGSENDTSLEVTTISNTGSGLSWVNQQHIGAGSGSGVACTMNLWTAVATVASSGTISLTYGGGSRNRGADVRQYRGATVGASAQEATGALTVSLTVAGANSTVVFCGYDFSAGTAPSAWTPAGHTTISNGLFGGAYTVSTQEWTGQTAGARAYGVSTGFGAGPTAKAVVELVDAGGAATDSAPIRGRIPAFRIPVVDRFFGQAFALRGDFGVGFDPLNLAVTPTAGTTATLTWDAAVLAGVTDYSIFQRTPATGVPFVPGVDTPTASSVAALTYAATGLTGSTSYEWQVFGRVPGTWAPTSLPSLVALYDASDAATITASAGAVSQWSDKATAGPYPLTQSTGTAQPATGNTMNGQNVIRFDGTNDTMGTTVSPITVNQPFTVFAVYKLNDATKGRVFDSGSRALYNPTVGASSPHGIYAGASANVASTQDTNPVCHLALFNGASSQVQINSTLTTGLNPSTTNLATLDMGGASVGAPSSVDWAVLAICSGDQSASFSTFLAYAQSFWGTP